MHIENSRNGSTLLTARGFAMPAVLGIIAVIIVAVGIGFYVSRGPTEVEEMLEGTIPGPSMKTSAPVVLNAQNNSGESGTAFLTEYEDRLGVDFEGELDVAILKKTKVTINLSGAPSGVLQPAHIHTGSCPTPGTVKYPLTSVTNGKSETILDVSPEELRIQLPLAVNVHKSSAEANVYIACGDITPDSMMMKKGEAGMMGKGMFSEGGSASGGMDKGAMMSETKTFSLTGRDFSFSQSEIRVKKGDRVKINFENVQGYHDWTVDEFNARTARVNAPGKASVEFVANKAGTFEYYCSVGSHRALGMVGKLIVE